jgi:hypothetical protein
MRDAEDRQPFFLQRNDRVHPVRGLCLHKCGRREPNGHENSKSQEETHHFLPPIGG